MEMEKNESNDLDSNQKAGFVKGTTALQLGLCEQLQVAMQAEPLNLTHSLFGQDSHNTVPSNLELKWKLPVIVALLTYLPNRCYRLQLWLNRPKSENYHSDDFSFYRARNHSAAYTTNRQIQFKKCLPKADSEKKLYAVIRQTCNIFALLHGFILCSCAEMGHILGKKEEKVAQDQ